MTHHDNHHTHCNHDNSSSTRDILHRALCCLFRPDTDGTRVSKCGQLSQQTRRLDPMLFQCWSSAVDGGPILKQHWVKSSRLLGSTQVSVYTHPSATIIFSPADQGTFSKTAGQSQAFYNTWNWERGTYDVNHLHILTCEGAVSRMSSVEIYLLLSLSPLTWLRKTRVVGNLFNWLNHSYWEWNKCLKVKICKCLISN